jgi:hypothetical protein
MENQDADVYQDTFDEYDENDENSSSSILGNLLSKGGSGEGRGGLTTGLEGGGSRRQRAVTTARERAEARRTQGSGSRGRVVDLADTETPVPPIREATATQQDIYLEPGQSVRRAASGPDYGKDMGVDPISRTTATARQANRDRAMIGEFNERMALEAERLGSPEGKAMLTAPDPYGETVESPTVDLNIDASGSDTGNVIRSATPTGKVIRGSRESSGRSVRDSRLGRQSTTIGRRSAFLGDRKVTRDNLPEVQRQFQEDRSADPDATDTSLHPNTIAFLQSRNSQLGGLVAGSTAGGTSAKGADAITRRTNTYRIGRPVGATFRDADGNRIDRNRADTKVKPVAGSASMAMPNGEPDVLSGAFELENPLQETLDPLAKDSEGNYIYNPLAGGADVLTDEQTQNARVQQAKDLAAGRTPAQTGRLPSRAQNPSGPYVNQPLSDDKVFSADIHEAAAAEGRSASEYTAAIQIDDANKTLGESAIQGSGSGEAQNILRAKKGDISAVPTRMIEVPTVSQRQFDRKTGTYTRGTGRYSVSQPMGADLLSDVKTDETGKVTQYGGVLAGVAAVDKPRASRIVEAMTVGTRRKAAPGEIEAGMPRAPIQRAPDRKSQSPERLEAARVAGDIQKAKADKLAETQAYYQSDVAKEYDVAGFEDSNAMDPFGYGAQRSVSSQFANVPRTPTNPGGISLRPARERQTSAQITSSQVDTLRKNENPFGTASAYKNPAPYHTEMSYPGFDDSHAMDPFGPAGRGQLPPKDPVLTFKTGSKLPWEESGVAMGSIAEAMSPPDTSTPEQRQENIQRIDSVVNDRRVTAQNREQTATRGRMARETFRRQDSARRQAVRTGNGETGNTNLSSGQFSGRQERFI